MTAKMNHLKITQADDCDRGLYDDSEDHNESNNARKESKVENGSPNKKKAIKVKPQKKERLCSHRFKL